MSWPVLRRRPCLFQEVSSQRCEDQPSEDEVLWLNSHLPAVEAARHEVRGGSEFNLQVVDATISANCEPGCVTNIEEVLCSAQRHPLAEHANGTEVVNLVLADLEEHVAFLQRAGGITRRSVYGHDQHTSLVILQLHFLPVAAAFQGLQVHAKRWQFGGTTLEGTVKEAPDQAGRHGMTLIFNSNCHHLLVGNSRHAPSQRIDHGPPAVASVDGGIHCHCQAGATAVRVIHHLYS
mmetsp:Transcript_37665/g.90005  ORF Transcript_37665/g.90005 Transcript_37665/m.90005 type:complete len:235 (+) Transcript_37665:362-1066(+)